MVKSYLCPCQHSISKTLRALLDWRLQPCFILKAVYLWNPQFMLPWICIFSSHWVSKADDLAFNLKESYNSCRNGFSSEREKIKTSFNFNIWRKKYLVTRTKVLKIPAPFYWIWMRWKETFLNLVRHVPIYWPQSLYKKLFFLKSFYIASCVLKNKPENDFDSWPTQCPKPKFSSIT